MFSPSPRMTFTHIPVMKTAFKIFRLYLAVPFCPKPTLNYMLDRINE